MGTVHPRLDALRQSRFPIVLGAESEDRGLYYARPSVEIASRIDAPWVEFPGIHLGFIPHPQIFGAALRAVATQMHSALSSVPDQWNKERASV